MKEVIDAFKERIKSPIFGYAAITFIAINWKPLFYLVVANVDILERFEYFDANTSLNSLILFPLGMAVLVAIVSPWINYVFLYISRKPTDLKNNLQVIQEHGLLSKKHEFEDARTELLANKERELIERAKRDTELNSIEEGEPKEKLISQINQLREDKDKAEIDEGYIQIDLIEIGQSPAMIPFDFDSTVQDLLNAVWIGYLDEHVKPYTYGETWILRDASTNDPLISQGREDIRPLLDAGVMGGMKLVVNIK